MSTDSEECKGVRGKILPLAARTYARVLSICPGIQCARYVLRIIKNNYTDIITILNEMK